MLLARALKALHLLARVEHKATAQYRSTLLTRSQQLVQQWEIMPQCVEPEPGAQRDMRMGRVHAYVAWAEGEGSCTQAVAQGWILQGQNLIRLKNHQTPCSHGPAAAPSALRALDACHWCDIDLPKGHDGDVLGGHTLGHTHTRCPLLCPTILKKIMHTGYVQHVHHSCFPMGGWA